MNAICQLRARPGLNARAIWAGGRRQREQQTKAWPDSIGFPWQPSQTEKSVAANRKLVNCPHLMSQTSKSKDLPTGQRRWDDWMGIEGGILNWRENMGLTELYVWQKGQWHIKEGDRPAPLQSYDLQFIIYRYSTQGILNTVLRFIFTDLLGNRILCLILINVSHFRRPTPKTIARFNLVQSCEFS